MLCAYLIGKQHDFAWNGLFLQLLSLILIYSVLIYIWYISHQATSSIVSSLSVIHLVYIHCILIYILCSIYIWYIFTGLENLWSLSDLCYQLAYQDRSIIYRSILISVASLLDSRVFSFTQVRMSWMRSCQFFRCLSTLNDLEWQNTFFIFWQSGIINGKFQNINAEVQETLTMHPVLPQPAHQSFRIS